MTLKDSLTSLLRNDRLLPLPESFLFGVATADHQCEAYDPEHVDIRDVWERVHSPKAARGKATDFWNRYEEDIELAQELGCTAFRFSIAWSRVEPEPGQFNQAAFDHYKDLIEKIISCRMQPILTLHHFTWPVHVERRGGMISDVFPSFFAGYVSEVARRFGKDVPYWVTFNEPNLLIGGYFKPWWDAGYAAPPGLPPETTAFEQVEAVGRLVRNLFLSHRAAYEIIKSVNPKAEVGVNQYFYGLPGWLQQLVNRNISGIGSDEELLGQRERLVLRPSLGKGNALADLFLHGRADVVMAVLTQTPEREQQVMFSEPYFVARQQLLVRVESSAAKSKDMADRAIAVVKGSVSEKDLPRLMPGAKAEVVGDYEAALHAILSGKADALLGDNAILYGLMERHPGMFRLIGDRLTDDEHYAAAVAQGDGDLLNVVDSVVREFKRSQEASEWRAEYERLTGQEVLEPDRAIRALTIARSSIEANARQRKSSLGPMPKAPEGTALRRIQDRGYLSIAVRQDLPGFAYPDSNTGELEGLEIDLARYLARKILGDSGKVRFVPVTTETRIPMLLPRLPFLDSMQKLYSILSSMLMTNWWYLGMAGELDKFLCPTSCAGKLDFVGLDYYWGISSLHPERVLRLMDAAYRHFDRAPVWPGALNGILKDLQRMFPDKPLIIFENGSVEEADGMGRAAYIREHIKEVQRAVQSGINVKGYVCWSLTSNREWDCEFCEASDFGLFHIGLDDDPSLKRKRTDAADAYQQIIRKRAA
jgi:beta-glucosidase/6-phospho-beta-glucosidase/beta-galactosidase/ABC-type amino acid transport substrate-binding protein